MGESRKRVTPDIKKAMFADYLAGMTFVNMAKKYGFSVNTINNTVVKNNWQEKKVLSHEAMIDTLRVKYINAGDDLIERHFKIASKLLDTLEKEIDNPESLINKEGEISQYKLGAYIDNYMKLVQQMNQLTGSMSAKDVYELKLKHEALEIKKLEKGIGIDEGVVEDNFLDALNATAINIGIGDDEGDEGEL